MDTQRERRARDMTLHKAMRMAMDECLTALRESIDDLTDGQFQGHHVEGRQNVATIVIHCLQQVDEFNGHLQRHRGIPGPVCEWHYLPFAERLMRWGEPAESLPRPGETFPTVEDTLALLDTLQEAVLTNMAAIPEGEFVGTPTERWPRLCDMFFRASYHINTHVRQIWLTRGLMGLAAWPEQSFA